MENFKSAVLELSQSSPEQQQQLNTIFGECQDLAD